MDTTFANNQTLEEWLEYTKKQNLTLEELIANIAHPKTCSHLNYTKLNGNMSDEKGKILFNLWEKEKSEGYENLSYLIPFLKENNIV